jgi:hypothetical protein
MGGESAHINGDLSDDVLRCPALHPGDGAQKLHLLLKRGHARGHLLADSLELLVQKVQVAKNLLQHEAVVEPKASFQGFVQLGKLVTSQVHDTRSSRP